MRIAVAALFLGFFSVSALAAEAEGKIATVDPDAMTITLQDGNTYKLPPEMDMSGLSDGVDVVIAYRVDEKGERQITDMLLPE